MHISVSTPLRQHSQCSPNSVTQLEYLTLLIITSQYDYLTDVILQNSRMINFFYNSNSPRLKSPLQSASGNEFLPEITQGIFFRAD